jgi:hypothetical protein
VAVDRSTALQRVREFKARIQNHLDASVDRHSEARQVHSAGVVGAYAPWGEHVSEEFLLAQRSLWIVFKDGYSFFEDAARIAQLKERFRNPALTSRIQIVHPDFKFLEAVRSMDDKKVDQRGDCLRAIKAMQAIRSQLKSEVDIHTSGRVEFIGHHSIPTWTGFIGDELAFVSTYFTRPWRGKLNTLVLRRSDEEGRPLPYYREMLFDVEDLWRNERERRGFASLFDYPVPA